MFFQKNYPPWVRPCWVQVSHRGLRPAQRHQILTGLVPQRLAMFQLGFEGVM